jgi:hypothetical protein
MDSVIVTGDPARTFRELLGSLMHAPLTGPVPEGPQTTTKAFDPLVVLDVEGKRLEMGEIRIDYHVEVGEHTIKVNAGDRVAALILRSLDGSYDKVIWDQDLQRYVVDSGTGIVQRRSGATG